MFSGRKTNLLFQRSQIDSQLNLQAAEHLRAQWYNLFLFHDILIKYEIDEHGDWIKNSGNIPNHYYLTDIAMANDLAKDTNQNRDVRKNNSKSFEILK